jgi:hypothetical protein
LSEDSPKLYNPPQRSQEMPAELISQNEKELTIQIKISLSSSML